MQYKQHDKMKFKNQYGPLFMYRAVKKRHKSCTQCKCNSNNSVYLYVS